MRSTTGAKTSWADGVYLERRHAFTGLGQTLVSYPDEQAAADAMQKLRSALEDCPSDKGEATVGSEDTYEATAQVDQPHASAADDELNITISIAQRDYGTLKILNRSRIRDRLRPGRKRRHQTADRCRAGGTKKATPSHGPTRGAASFGGRCPGRPTGRRTDRTAELAVGDGRSRAVDGRAERRANQLTGPDHAASRALADRGAGGRPFAPKRDGRRRDDTCGLFVESSRRAVSGCRHSG